jgi:hypothetical protein
VVYGWLHKDFVPTFQGQLEDLIHMRETPLWLDARVVSHSAAQQQQPGVLSRGKWKRR